MAKTGLPRAQNKLSFGKNQNSTGNILSVPLLKGGFGFPKFCNFFRYQYLGTFANPAPSLIVSFPKSIPKEQDMFKKLWILSGLALILAATLVFSNHEPVLA